VTTTRPIRTIHVSRHFKEKVDFDMQIIMNADLWELGNRIKNKEIELDLILGHSKGRWTASDNIIPIWYA
jgi:nitrogenase molybdenum-iron protein beta chain